MVTRIWGHLPLWCRTLFLVFLPCPTGLPSPLDGAGGGEDGGSGLSRGREHCSHAGGAELPAQRPNPFSSPFQALPSPPQRPVAEGPASVCAGRARGADPLLGFVWGSAPRQPDWAGRERGCSGILRLVLRAPPSSSSRCLLPGSLGDRKERTQWQPCEKGTTLP